MPSLLPPPCGPPDEHRHGAVLCGVGGACDAVLDGALVALPRLVEHHDAPGDLEGDEERGSEE